MSNATSASNRIHLLEVVGNAIVGGMESHVSRLVERLPADRFAVSVLCPFESPFTDHLRAHGAEVCIAAMPEDLSWCSVQMTCGLIKANTIDVLHAHLPNAHLLAGVAGRLAGRPVVATVHGRQIAPLDLEVHRACASHLNVVCKQSYFHALGVGVNPSQLHFIGNGVDTDVFKPGRTRDGPLRRRLGIPPDALVVGFAGRLSWEKGPDVFLRTALTVRQRMPGAHFVLAGEGPMTGQLEAFVDQYGLGSTVHLAGMLGDMPAVLAEFDVMASTSHTEATPLALMEAMASGLPVVATKVGGVPDMVQHGVTGWLANAGDSDGLAFRIVALLADESLRLEAGRAGRLRAVEHFALDTSVRSTMQLLTRLAQSRVDPQQRRISAVASDGKLVGATPAPTPDSVALA